MGRERGEARAQPRNRPRGVPCHLPLHGLQHRRALRVQVDLKADAANAGGHRRRAAGGGDNAAPPEQPQHHKLEGRVRGRRCRAFSDEAVRGSSAFRPHCGKGPLL